MSDAVQNAICFGLWSAVFFVLWILEIRTAHRLRRERDEAQAEAHRLTLGIQSVAQEREAMRKDLSEVARIAAKHVPKQGLAGFVDAVMGAQKQP